MATIIVGVMYLGLTFAIAEMGAALPHTGAAYSFARTAMGPWGGFLTGADGTEADYPLSLLRGGRACRIIFKCAS
ncbi:MAG TPA: hypothetical protein VFZ21_28110 [Gemmatimonadaceae bacterium]|nr:hypothetical protein [Gemmatimonadaceae bacterium]